MSGVSLSKLLSTDDLTNVALKYQLDPSDPQIRIKIIDYLRKKDLLLEDFHFNFVPPKINLSEFLCQRFRDDSLLTSFKLGQCSPLTERIANNMILVGAVRIFVQPERSFVEPVINAVDAYQIKKGKPPVGKFGIGFYSLFYWLIKYPGSVLTVSSGYDGSDSAPWKLTINSKLELFLEKIKPPGFKFRLEMNIIKPRIKISIPYQIENATRYISSCQIEIHTNEEIITTGQGEDIVKVECLNRNGNLYFTVEDNALGLPIYYLNNLLIPTLSSKMIQNKPYIPKIGKLTGINIDDRDDGNLIIGEIPIKSYSGYFIQLSPETALPVARDNILLSRHLVKEEFEMNVFYLLEEMIREFPQNGINALLRDLDNDTQTKYLIPIIIERIKQKGCYIVPIEYWSVYKKITTLPLIGYQKFKSLDLETEKKIIADSSVVGTPIFVGKIAYEVDIPGLTFANTMRLVFLPKITDIASLVVRFPEVIPRNPKWLSQLAKIDRIEEAVAGQKNKDLFRAFYSRLLGLRTIFRQDGIDRASAIFKKFIPTKVESGTDILEYETFIEDVVALYNNLLNQFLPNVAYGSGLKNLYTNILVGFRRGAPDKSNDSKTLEILFEKRLKDDREAFLKIFSLMIPLMVEEDVIFIPIKKMFIDHSPELKPEERIVISILLGLGIVGDEDQIIHYWNTYLYNERLFKLLLRELINKKYAPGFGGKKSIRNVLSLNLEILTPMRSYLELVREIKAVRYQELPALYIPKGESFSLCRRSANRARSAADVSLGAVAQAQCLSLSAPFIAQQ